MTAKGNEVELFTDGACIGNPGPGGWAFILRHRATGHTKEASGGERETTNNRMEITAAIAGLEALKAPCVVALHSDSQYVIKVIRSWMVKWKRLGWRKTANAAARVKNGYLWERLDALLQTHQVTPTWVREHAGHRENERCDALAASAAAAMAAECLAAAANAAAANAAAAAANAAATDPSRKDVVDDPR